MPARPPATRKDKFIIIFTVIVIFIVAGGIVIVARACGGDEPAPTALTSGNVEKTTSTAPRTQSTTTSSPASVETAPTASTASTVAAVSGLRDVDWAAESGAAPAATSPASADNGFLESVTYQDLTGDGNEDALVLVRRTGSGALLDYYVYSYEGGAPVLLFERHGLSHGKAEPGKLPYSIVETTPVYGPEEPNCCPGNLQLTTYTWSASAKVFVETTVETVPNPQ